MSDSDRHGPQARLIKWLVFTFFTVYLALGLMLVPDYGMTWDDEFERLHGLVVMDYFNELSGDRLFEQAFSEYRLEEYFNRHYGTAFQMVAMVFENVLGLDDPREWFLLRHYMTFMVWFIALAFFYRLVNLQFKNPAFSLVGVIFMILSPRIFADAFYNSKDVIFLAFYIITAFTLLKFLKKPSLKSAVYLALATALLINTRILGVIMPTVSLMFIFLKLIQHRKSMPVVKDYIKTTSFYILLLIAFTILFWPYLWEHPFLRLIESFRTMGHFPWDDTVLYWGRFIPATDLPWHYIPSWILITTPILYTVFFLAGTGDAIFKLFRDPFNADYEGDLVMIALFFMPLFAVIILHSTLYDGWRQMFFLYGPFMVLAMRGFYMFLHRSKTFHKTKRSVIFRVLLFLAVIWTLASVSIFMIRDHPHQNVFFNVLAGKETTKNFEADYWGLSYKQALENILEQDPRDSIPVFAINYPGRANALILPPEERARLTFVGPDQADYWISNYRFPSEHDRYFNQEPPYNKTFWEKEVQGNPIVGIYLLPQ